MRNFVSLELVYFYVLLKNYLRKNNSANYNKIKDCVLQNTFFNKLCYSRVQGMLMEIYNFDDLKNAFLKNDEKTALLPLIENLEKIIYFEFFPKKYINADKNEILENLNNFVAMESIMPNDEIIVFLFDLAKFLSKKFKKVQNAVKSFELINLYAYFTEYMELFEDLESITFNDEKIAEKFSVYFKYFSIFPRNVVFYNTKQNMKIMQNLFPEKFLIKILEDLGFKFKNAIPAKCLLMELDAKMLGGRIDAINHEVGHLLNLKLFDFQRLLLNELYAQNPSVDIPVLSSWLNEIIADVIGYNISQDKLGYVEFFESLEKRESDWSVYPPDEIRLYYMTGKEYGDLVFNSQKLVVIEKLLLKNKDYIKNMLSIVKTG